jgi:hypothetical protein
MVCVPVRGVPLVGYGVLRRRGSLRSACPRSLRLVWPSGLSGLPGRLVRVSPSPAMPSVPAHSAVCGSSARGCRVSCLGIHSRPLFRALRSGSSRFRFGPGSFLMDLQNTCLSRCRVHSPASSVWLRECSARVLIGPWQHGPVRCLLRPRRAVPVRRLWCFPFAVNRSRQPVPARRVRCDAVASWFTANCFPMSSERWMGNSRGFVSIDVSGSGFASSAGFPSRRLARSVFRGEDGILRSLVRVSPFRKVWIDALHAVPSLSPWFLVRCLASRLGFPVRFSSMVIHHLGVLAVFPDVSHAARN